MERLENDRSRQRSNNTGQYKFMTGHVIFSGLYSQNTIEQESHMDQVLYDLIKSQSAWSEREIVTKMQREMNTKQLTSSEKLACETSTTGWQ